MDLMGLLSGAGGDELDSYELEGGPGVVGDDVLGALVGALVGAAKRGGHHGAPMRPRWRRQLAPGVPVPDYGVFPVPLSPQTNNGTFTATIANIEYRTTAQVPFRGERLLTRVARVGASAAGSIVFAQNGIFIGIRPQIGVLGALPLEDFSAQAFGVRLVMQQATQGADVRAFTFIQPLVSGTDTLTLSIQILGRVAR
jgi:hypothetical protein